MGDHRANIKIEFTMHDVTSKADLCINWWFGVAPNDLPSSVLDFFEMAEQASMLNFHDVTDKAEADSNEKAEREELARLKAKYEPS